MTTQDASLEKRISALRNKRLMVDLFQWPSTPVIRREPSNNEREAKKHDIFKCVHGLHYFVECTKCRRGAKQALAWEEFWLRQSSKQKS
jgi:hypothetical protein